MVDWVPQRFAYRRSPFQVALLIFATLGFYLFVWAFWVRRWCAAALERQDQPLWKTVAMVIPIFNFFLMFELGKMIEGVVWRAQLPPPRLSLPWIGLSVFVFSVLWKLPDPYGALGMLIFLPYAYLQIAFVRAQHALTGLGPTPLRWWEWVIAVLGFALQMLIAFALALPNDGIPVANPWFGWALLGVAVVMLGAIARASRGIPIEPRATPVEPLR